MMNFAIQRTGWIIACVALLATSVAAGQEGAPQGNTLPSRDHIPTHSMRNGEVLPKAMTPTDKAVEQSSGQSSPGRMISRRKHWQFAQKVNVAGLRDLAVFNGGRVAIVGTLAQQKIKRICGRTYWFDPVSGHSYGAVFTYFDLLFDKAYYTNKPIIDVQVLPLRRKLVDNLVTNKKRRQWWLHEGRLTPRMIMEGAIRRILTMQESDLRQSNGVAQVMWSAMTLNSIGHHLKLISPLPGSSDWARLDQIKDTRLASAGGPEVLVKPIVTNTALGRQVVKLWAQLGVAWRALDATRVNQIIKQLASILPRLNPSTYPGMWRRQLEHFYNATHRLTVGWMVYFLATVTLLIAFMIGRKWVIRLGVGLLVTGFGIHALSIAIRAILAQRWPIDNQYESFIAITFFAVLAGMILMWVRKQWLFGAAAGMLGTAALLLANLAPIPSRGVDRVAGILATSWVLPIHVDTVLFSYALIALGFFLSLFYLFFYYFGREDVAAATAGDHGGVLRFAAASVGQLPGGPDSDTPAPGRAKLLHDLDKAQLVVLQIGFWLLGTGTLLGAYWANHAWGRWWGWDPKETWALITWIIYLIALHVRYGVKRRGLSTAWLSVVGFFVMCWTYWGVNLLIAGLHSYA